MTQKHSSGLLQEGSVLLLSAQLHQLDLPCRARPVPLPVARHDFSGTKGLFPCDRNMGKVTCPYGTGRSRGKIEHPPAYKWSPIVDCHHNGFDGSSIRHADA
jgi:hypothetical protein